MTPIEQLIERQALRDVVDTFSNLADENRLPEQMPLFTPDATVLTHIGDTVLEMHGTDEILKTFTEFTQSFKQMYHMNGQHTVTFTSDTTASAILYCAVKLQNDTAIQSHSVRYVDEYVKRDGKWLICKRVSYFLMSE